MTFDDAVKAHGAELFRFAYWLSRDRHRAEDIVQEALLRGWKAFGGLQDRGAVKSWMFSIVRNEYYRMIGGDGPRMDSLDEGAFEIADPRANLFGLEMRDAMQALPVALAEPLALQVLGGFSCAEIATMLETTEGAVMTRLTRARQALKRLVTPADARARKGDRS